MKFNTDLDAQTFLIEISNFDKLKDADKYYEPTNEELRSFLKARSPLVKKIKNHRKSSMMKANWRENRLKMMKGIKAFHKSVGGKRFHRQLGNFIASRIFRPKTRSNESLGYQMLLTKQGYLKGLNSAKQHVLVELEYFHQLQEQIELEEFIVGYAFPYFKVIEEKIISDETLTEDEMVFIFDLLETNSIIKSISEKTGQTFAQIEKLWNAISNDLKIKGVSKEDNSYFPSLVTRIKEDLGTK